MQIIFFCFRGIRCCRTQATTNIHDPKFFTSQTTEGEFERRQMKGAAAIYATLIFVNMVDVARFSAKNE